MGKVHKFYCLIIITITDTVKLKASLAIIMNFCPVYIQQVSSNGFEIFSDDLYITVYLKLSITWTFFQEEIINLY